MAKIAVQNKEITVLSYNAKTTYISAGNDTYPHILPLCIRSVISRLWRLWRLNNENYTYVTHLITKKCVILHPNRLFRE